MESPFRDRRNRRACLFRILWGRSDSTTPWIRSLVNFAHCVRFPPFKSLLTNPVPRWKIEAQFPPR